MQNKSKVTKVTRVRVGSKWRLITNTLFNCNIDKEAKAYTEIANRFLKTNGPKWTCARLKDYYNFGVRLSLDIEVPIIPFCKTKGKIPMDLRIFIPKLMSPHINERRACLTLLRVYTQLHSEVNKDTETIERKGPTESLFQEYKHSFTKICEKYKSFLNPKIVDEGLFTTSKKGPNGPALLNVDKDFVSIKESGILDTIKKLNLEIEKVLIKRKGREIMISRGFASEYDNPSPNDLIETLPRSERKLSLYNAMENFIQWQKSRDPRYYDDVISSKIGFIAEGGCKTRVIAIGDYFTQDCLKPIHRSLYRLLNKLKTDGTSSHNIISQVVREKTSQKNVVRSFDLTAFTDRFPIFIQEYVMSILYNPKISTLWRKLIVDREFKCDDRMIRYSCGQPMGFLSSWAAASVTHHITVEACAYKIGKTNFTNYCLIGDDVTIFDSDVAKEYRRFLNHFSIDISEAKSLQSDGNPSSAEIAKRIFMNGEEISPIPFDAIESAIKDYLLFPNLIRLAIERGIKQDTLDTALQSALPSIFPKGNKADKVLSILSYPLQKLPLGITSVCWKDFTIEEIQCEMERIHFEYVTQNARLLYNENLAKIPDMGHLGVALESDLAPIGLEKHPLMIVLRHYRDRCGSIYQCIVIENRGPKELENLDFLVDPLIPSYMRRTHRLERINSSLILKVNKALRDQLSN